MKYIAYVEQISQGCKYSIACGKELWILDATTRDGAIAEARRRAIGDWLPDYQEYADGFWNDYSLAKITLYEVAGFESLPIDTWYKEAVAFAEREKSGQDEDLERAEYQRLKAKYEGR